MDHLAMPLAHLTLATRDVAATAEFFRFIFDWKNTPKAKNSAVDVEWLDIGNGQELHVIGVPDFEVSPFEREYGRHVAFFVGATDFDGVKKRLHERGIEPHSAERPTPFERFFFRDPNGYVIEVIDQDAWATSQRS